MSALLMYTSPQRKKAKKACVFLCKSECVHVYVSSAMCVWVARLLRLRAAARTGGSGAVLWDTLTPDPYSITRCCCGGHKSKTQSDLIGCDWSCCGSIKPSGTLIFVVREKQEIQMEEMVGRGSNFMGWKWRTSQGFLQPVLTYM